MKRPPRRLTSHATGRRGETWAAALMLMKGYRILARRFHAGGGEIDLVVKRGNTIVFVEVKARHFLDDAVIAISPQKEMRLSRAVRYWLARNPWAVNMTLRCDAVFVARRKLPHHVPDVATLAID
jgi:putative endonuclease